MHPQKAQPRQPPSNRYQTPGQRSTRTGVPAGQSVDGGTSTNPLDRAIDRSMCEAWTPADRTCPDSSKITRMKCRRRPGFDRGTDNVPTVAGNPTSADPCKRRRAGKAIKTAVTNAETGFPGNPMRYPPRSVPKNTGFPGLMATLKKSSCPPNRSQAGRRKSRSPTEAPPAVITRSPSDSADSRPSMVASS